MPGWQPSLLLMLWLACTAQALAFVCHYRSKQHFSFSQNLINSAKALNETPGRNNDSSVDDNKTAWLVSLMWSHSTVTNDGSNFIIELLHSLFTRFHMNTKNSGSVIQNFIVVSLILTPTIYKKPELQPVWIQYTRHISFPNQNLLLPTNVFFFRFVFSSAVNSRWQIYSTFFNSEIGKKEEVSLGEMLFLSYAKVLLQLLMLVWTTPTDMNNSKSVKHLMRIFVINSL